MAHVWAAIRLLSSKPKLWPAALAPMLLAAFANLGLLIFTLQRLIPWLGQVAEERNVPNSFGWVAAGTVVAGAWILVAGPIFIMLFGIFSVPAWDALSRQVETEVNGQAPEGRLSCLGIVIDIVVRLSLAVLLGGSAFLLGCIGFGVVGAALCGWMMLFDLSAPTYARRGIGVFKQYKVLFQCEGWQGFWIAASLASILPFVNVFMLPILVVAATLMVLSHERKAKPVVSKTVE